jgi:hypothetical protein
MRWEGHVARMVKRNAYRLLVGKPDGKRPLGSPRRRCVDNIRMGPGEVGWGDVDWIGLAQDKNRWRALLNSVLNFRVPWNAILNMLLYIFKCFLQSFDMETWNIESTTKPGRKWDNNIKIERIWEGTRGGTFPDTVINLKNQLMMLCLNRNMLWIDNSIDGNLSIFIQCNASSECVICIHFYDSWQLCRNWDRSDTFLRNVGLHKTYTAPRPRPRHSIWKLLASKDGLYYREAVSLLVVAETLTEYAFIILNVNFNSNNLRSFLLLNRLICFWYT